MANSTISGMKGMTIQTTPDLLDSIKRQMEFYFSSENLFSDKYLMSQMDANKSVAISVVMKFAKMKQLTTDENVVIDALKDSDVCVIENGRVRGLLKNLVKSTLILRDIPSDAPEAQVRNLFNFPNCAPIVNIRSDIGDTWFVLFDGEDDARNALAEMKSQKVTFEGNPIKGRVKTETITPRSFAPQYSSAPGSPQAPPSAYISAPMAPPQPGMPMYPYSYPPPPGTHGMPVQMNQMVFPGFSPAPGVLAPPAGAFPGVFPDVNINQRGSLYDNHPHPTGGQSGGMYDDNNNSSFDNNYNGNNNGSSDTNNGKGGKGTPVTSGEINNNNSNNSNNNGNNSNNSNNNGNNNRSNNSKGNKGANSKQQRQLPQDTGVAASAPYQQQQQQQQQPAQSAMSESTPALGAAPKPVPGTWAEKLLNGNMDTPTVDPSVTKKKVGPSTVNGSNSATNSNGNEKKDKTGDNAKFKHADGDKKGKDGRNNNNGNKGNKSGAGNRTTSTPKEAEGNQRKPSEEIVPPPADWGGKPTFLQIMKEKAAAAADGAN